MKRSIRAAAFCVALCLFFSLFASVRLCAAEKHLPTLYIGDDAWYKDLSAPLIIGEDGTFFLPLEAFALLPSITLRHDETVGAALLIREDRSLSFDTESGVRILPGGDEQLSIRHENGTVYLALLPVVSLLGLGFELHTYQNGETAVRINDGSGIFPFSSLVRMYAEEELSPARTVLPAAKTADSVTLLPVSPASFPETANSLSAGTILLFRAEDILSLSSEENVIFGDNLARLLSRGAVPALYSLETDPDTALHYLIQANNRLLSAAHRGAYLYLSDLKLTDEQAQLYEKAGLILFGNIPELVKTQEIQSTGDNHAGNS